MMQWILREAADYVREGLEPLGYKVRYPEEVIRDRLSVFLSASHPVTHGSWPYPPNVIEVGGMHLKDPKTLPRNLKKFMDSAARGVVYVSFGSTIKPSQMPKEKLSAFIETFKRLEESVLWKWDADIQDLPENVLTSSWVPQQDVLGHPNLKVFVTHGGMGSVMEAIHHKERATYSVEFVICRISSNLTRFATEFWTNLFQIRSQTPNPSNLTNELSTGQDFGNPTDERPVDQLEEGRQARERENAGVERPHRCGPHERHQGPDSKDKS